MTGMPTLSAEEILSVIMDSLFLVAIDLDTAKAGGNEVREVIAGERQIIHIRDWHLVRQDASAADTRLTGRELDAAYADHVRDVESIQKSVRGLLSAVREVYAEGLS